MSALRSASSLLHSPPPPKKNFINGDLIKFYNEICHCQLRAEIKFSKSEANPNRLYYNCPKTAKCGFFKWWTPFMEEMEEIRALAHILQLMHNNVNETDIYDQDVLVNRLNNIEAMLMQLKKCQIMMFMLFVIVFIIYCNAS